MNFRLWLLFLSLAASACCAASPERAQSPAPAWLGYPPLGPGTSANYSALPHLVLVLDNSPVLQSAGHELVRGLHGMLGGEFQLTSALPNQPFIFVGNLKSLGAIRQDRFFPVLSGDGFWISVSEVQGSAPVLIAGNTDRAVLYGTFAFLGKISRGEPLSSCTTTSNPVNSIRMIDQWDNLDGTIERGYAGPSLFFEDGHVRGDLSRAAQYARLLSSVAINIVAINNVNADSRVLQNSFLPQLSRVAEAFRPWGIRLALSVDISSPKTIGGLDTFDPLDPRVARWWQRSADALYKQIPDFAGFVVKADSEGRAGPTTYQRTPADAANVIARALEPYGGFVFYRSFVYDHHLDWREKRNDRAKAAYAIFQPLDGQFAENVIVQIKNGPIDFQVREPVSPLLGGLRKTSEAIELQITQEYTGQQRHLCFLAPLWKQALDFDLRNENAPTPVHELVSGKIYHRRVGGLVGVANAGMDANWLAHPLALANLYAFGRLAWDPELPAQSVADDWTRLTFGNDPMVVTTIEAMLLASWNIYESYTGPLGIGTLTDILGDHYSPAPGFLRAQRLGPVASRRSRGRWHGPKRRDRHGVRLAIFS